ncbi:hypothetical protein KIPB_009364, partial [Kipferlia bialata]
RERERERDVAKRLFTPKKKTKPTHPRDTPTVALDLDGLIIARGKRGRTTTLLVRPGGAELLRGIYTHETQPTVCVYSKQPKNVVEQVVNGITGASQPKAEGEHVPESRIKVLGRASRLSVPVPIVPFRVWTPLAGRHTETGSTLYVQSSPSLNLGLGLTVPKWGKKTPTTDVCAMEAGQMVTDYLDALKNNR